RGVAAHVALRRRNRRELEDPEGRIVVRDEVRLAILAHVEDYRVELTPHREPFLIQPFVLERQRLAERRNGYVRIADGGQAGNRTLPDTVDIPNGQRGVPQVHVRFRTQEQQLLVDDDGH